jgi:hypothetical protein
MTDDAQRKARANVKRAQSTFERSGDKHEEARQVRRQSFEQARKAGLTLREIGEAANLHRSRVAEVLSKK